MQNLLFHQQAKCIPGVAAEFVGEMQEKENIHKYECFSGNAQLCLSALKPS